MDTQIKKKKDDFEKEKNQNAYTKICTKVPAQYNTEIRQKMDNAFSSTPTGVLRDLFILARGVLFLFHFLVSNIHSLRLLSKRVYSFFTKC